MSQCDQDMVGEMAEVFKALGDFNRLCIIYLLASDAGVRRGVGDLAQSLGISQPAASQHLKILRHIHIVEASKEGNHVYYSFNREMMARYTEQFGTLSRMILEKCKQDSLKKT